MESAENTELTQRIENYIRGTMSQQESAKFEEDCQADAQLNEQYQLQVLAKYAIWQKGREDEKDVFRNLYREIVSERRSPVFLQKKWLSLAAIILLLVTVAGIGWSILGKKQASPEDIFAAYYEVPRAPETMGDGDNLRQYYSSYRKGDFASVVEQYDSVIHGDTLAFPEATFFLGISLLELNRPVECAKVLEKTTFVPEQTMWYKSLAWLKAGNLAEARAKLESIVSQPGHYYQDKAAALLDNL
ncbi:MAG: hypothetical protein R3D00_26485 [Bacteroidia bacterium]